MGLPLVSQLTVTTPMPLKTPPNPPVASQTTTKCDAHGKQWIDQYAWLKADNWQEALDDPDKLPSSIADYLHAENKYHDQATDALVPLQSTLVSEMRGRMAENDDTVPMKEGNYKYSERYVENLEHELYIRTDLNGDHEELLFDVNMEAEKHEYFELGQLENSPNHTKIFWTSDTSGAEYYTLRVRDLESNADDDTVIDKVEMATWADDETLLYVRLDESHRALKVYRHVLGTSVQDDTLVFEEKDNRFTCSVYTSLSGEYVFIHTSMNDQDEVWYVPVQNSSTTPVLIQERAEGLEYGVDHQGDRFVICANSDGAVDFKIVEAPVNTPAMQFWTDIVEYHPGRMIEDIVVYKDWIVWLETIHALPQIAYMDKSGVINRIEFDEEAYSLDLVGSLEFDKSSLLYEYSSPTTPAQTIEFNLLSGERAVLKQESIPSGHNPEDYATRRVMALSHDGAEVPVTLLYRQDTPVDGTAAAIIYGYGSYGASSYAEFSSDRLSLVDRGFVFAIAHVRGGQEKGRTWYEDAKLELKPNSFHDFIAVGDALIEQGYCAPNKLVSLGGSAGGLLVAASMNMKPDLFAGVIAHVPFVDVLNTMLDDTLPLTPSEWTQWGNPIESMRAFESIRSYSPYENIQPVSYPPLYVTAGVSDPRVTYWEPAKWVASLRATKTDNNIVLLKTNMQSGHFGKTGRFAELDDRARAYAFAIAVTTDN